MKVEAGPIYGKKKHLSPSLYQAPTIYFTFLYAFFYVSSKSSQAWPSCSPWRGEHPSAEALCAGLGLPALGLAECTVQLRNVPEEGWPWWAGRHWF